ncbi:alpha/beta hydrolase [Caldimonas sp. KR1-144]|uniref:alpha/beta hydrolase n=1 Tax=Caldimonas sp. KR1-144 TaxID=3400911 RepID=UPI003C05C3A8
MLDKQLAALVAQSQAAGVPDLCDLPPAACRGLYRQILAAADVPPADVAVADRRIERPDADGTLGLRIYTPRGQGPHPLVVYYHGGGFVLGDLDGYDRVCRRLCEDSAAVIVSVDYRLAPEHPFPAAVDDAWTALAWAAQHAGELGADANRLAVAGDSAGGTLAAAMTLLARERGAPRIARQALVYPATAAGRDGPYDSRSTYAAGPTLTARSMDYFTRHYFGPSGRAPDLRGAPILAESLADLPPALLLVARHDPLRDEVIAYGTRLLEAGTPAIVVEYHGLAHGFISMAGSVDAARLAQQQLGQFLRAMASTRDK